LFCCLDQFVEIVNARDDGESKTRLGFVEKFVGSIPSYHSDLLWTDVEASRGELGSEDQECRRLMLLRRSSVVDVGERLIPGLFQQHDSPN
jgi:hypothetical protein